MFSQTPNLFILTTLSLFNLTSVLDRHSVVSLSRPLTKLLTVHFAVLHPIFGTNFLSSFVSLIFEIRYNTSNAQSALVRRNELVLADV